jgi:calcium-dependent protein kinase
MRKKYKSTDVCLGKGSFGHVFLFKSLDGVQKFAVKIMVKELIPEKELKVVKEEIVILSKMEHPHIINYFESYEDTRYLFIVMEYAEEAIELKSMITKQHEKLVAGQPLMSETEVARIMQMLVSGVLHIHASNVVHRDLKPENCLIDKENKIKIIDFGLAKTDESDLIGSAMVGTPYYMAPEIFEEHGDENCYKPPVDIYALGIIMYELISGNFPFKEGDDLE